MNKWILSVMVALMAFTAIPVKAEATKEDWANYATLRDKAHADLTATQEGTYTGDTVTAVSEWLDIAKLGETTLERKEISAWGYNNAAYTLIWQFKNKLDWKATHKALKAMPVSTKEERQAKLDKVREMQKLASENFELLSEAGNYLGQAQKVGFSNDDFKGKLKSNRDFLKWVNGFIHKEYK